MVPTALHERLLVAVGDRTYRHLGELTKTHPETVRRYMQGQAPGADFLAALCAALGVSGDWLLTGRGAMRLDEQRTQALREANAGDLFTAMAHTLETLMERVDRLEMFVQTMEVRVRGRGPRAAGEITPKDTGHPRDGKDLTLAKDLALVKDVNHATAAGPSAPAPVPQRVQRLQGVLAQRPRPDAG